MRPNQILKIATERNPNLSLSKTSTFSLVSYEQVYSYIIENMEKSGTETLMNSIATLSEIAIFFQTDPIWGEYEYSTPLKASADQLDPKTMLTNYKNFIDQGMRL